MLEQTCLHFNRAFLNPAQAVRWCCAWLGFEVCLAPWLPLGQRGEVDFDEGVIRLNPLAYTAASKNRGTDRQAETLAHELAHVRLHEAQFRAGVTSQEQEDEAQTYARIFLVPRRKFEPHVPRVASDHLAAYRYSREWGVSPGMITARARELEALAAVMPSSSVPEMDVETVDRLFEFR